MTLLLTVGKAFLCGGAICLVGQILIDRTALTPGKVLVLFVVCGVALGAVGLYGPFARFAGAYIQNIRLQRCRFADRSAALRRVPGEPPTEPNGIQRILRVPLAGRRVADVPEGDRNPFRSKIIARVKECFVLRFAKCGILRIRKVGICAPDGQMLCFMKRAHDGRNLLLP